MKTITETVPPRFHFSSGAVVENKYRIDSPLGEGAMGTVFLAQDLVLERQVALKFVHSDGSELFRQQFQQEAANMARIRHPHVAEVYAHGEEDGQPFLVMEFVAGENLLHYLQRSRPLDLDVALGILGQICAGIDAIHSQGVVHRDVKTENVIVDPNYRICIVDFGVSHDLTLDVATFGGTPGYIAPEVALDQQIPAGARHLCDIFGIGVCAFELLSGALPFQIPDVSTHPIKIICQVAQQSPQLLSAARQDLPLSFDDAFRRVLARNPEERFPTATAFYEELRHLRDVAAKDGDANSQRILVVDDDPDIRQLYRAVLEVSCPTATIRCAQDGLEALELAKIYPPSLILLDLNMPQVNGLELCGLLRGTAGLECIPIVVISAQLDDAISQTLRNLGAAESLAKPIEPRQLAAIAQRYLP